MDIDCVVLIGRVNKSKHITSSEIDVLYHTAETSGSDEQ